MILQKLHIAFVLCNVCFKKKLGQTTVVIQYCSLSKFLKKMLVMDRIKVEILQNCVTFSEFMNFTIKLQTADHAILLYYRK